MQDETIKCQDCGKDFIFPVHVQKSFAEKGYNKPKRCRDCAAKRREQIERKNAESR